MMKQGADIEGKIVIALERIAQVMRFLYWEIGKKFGLTPLQIQFLLYLDTHSREECSVTHLARQHQLTKATTSVTIKILLDKGLLKRIPHPSDHRHHLLVLTKKGQTLIPQLRNRLDPLQKIMTHFSEEEKAKELEFLLKLINELERAGLIARSRICFSCDYFRTLLSEDGPSTFYCEFLERPLSRSDLRVDCPDHLPIAMD